MNKKPRSHSGAFLFIWRRRLHGWMSECHDHFVWSKMGQQSCREAVSHMEVAY